MQAYTAEGYYSFRLGQGDHLKESPLIADLMNIRGSEPVHTGKKVGLRVDTEMPCDASVDTSPIRKQWPSIDILVTIGHKVHSELEAVGVAQANYGLLEEGNSFGVINIAYPE